ncbi:MAG: RNA polymerase sigma factor [Syntrophomonadaceae bacterium]|nr:RNA polymerase sigma factor [Syntrophomonadaceae bacterium]
MITGDELKNAAEGDINSIELVCSDMWEPLYRFIYFKVQNREEAEDITQETFVRLLTYVQEQRVSVGNLPGFLKTAALNILRDRWRQKQRRGIPINFEKINPVEVASMAEQRAVAQRLQINNALEKLSTEQRKVLELRIIKGYSVAETARLTGKTQAAVRTSQHRALKALAEILDDND